MKKSGTKNLKKKWKNNFILAIKNLILWLTKAKNKKENIIKKQFNI